MEWGSQKRGTLDLKVCFGEVGSSSLIHNSTGLRTIKRSESLVIFLNKIDWSNFLMARKWRRAALSKMLPSSSQKQAQHFLTHASIVCLRGCCLFPQGCGPVSWPSALAKESSHLLGGKWKGAEPSWQLTVFSWQ